MNSTSCLFVKVAILLALSCQVIRAEFSGGLQLLEEHKDFLDEDLGSKLRRRQVDLKSEDGKKDAAAAGKEKSGSKEEQLASKLFEGIIEMGVGLEAVTNLGSSTKDILDESKKVSSIVPKLKSLTADLLNSAPNKNPQLSQAVEESSKAGESIAKSLVAIEAKPDDANTIKGEFKNLEKSFQQILATSDGVAVAAIPKLAELAGGQAPQGAGKPDEKGASVNLQAAAPNPATEKKDEPKKEEPKKEEPKKEEPKKEEPKKEEPKTEEPKKVEENKPAEVAPAAAATVEAKGAIEPIDTGVVV
ncbi:hypothetical protein PCASD_01613 [Puccinia coronata f. sp. avenae]|uniref:Uncharacterized protein n=1 Tax=Puccinia coronata f. sp. avenae TaxID=200324 RepID=A0A2N5VIK8_9BASI|nr:hypothetical protein PCASD_01613 [Puccinia coronata f. sp. avenae]